MTILTVINFGVKSAVLRLQLSGDWYSDNKATVTMNNKVKSRKHPTDPIGSQACSLPACSPLHIRILVYYWGSRGPGSSVGVATD
jgi:hypothetical protein